MFKFQQINLSVQSVNFLAHLFLSEHHEDLLIGNFLADYLKNKEVAKLPRPVQEGIRLHRKIDSFTDKHPAVLNSVRRLRPVHGKFAPVVLDVCFDYVLIKNWDKYSDIHLKEFTQEVYKILEKNIHIMPEFLQRRLPHMIADDWLVGYGTKEGLEFTFSRMKLRTSFPRFFENAVDSLMKDYQLYEDDFNLFFPDIIDAVKNWKHRSE